MDFLKKITSAKEKYNLYIEIHNLKANFNRDCDLMVKIKRGRTKNDNTPAKIYSPAMGEVIFEHSVEFTITAYRNHRNLMQKLLQFKVFKTEKGKTKQDGEVEVEITELAESGRSLSRVSMRIKGCSDPMAELCISVEMQPAEKSRANSMKGRSQRRAISEDNKLNLAHFNTYNPSMSSSLVKPQGTSKIETIYEIESEEISTSIRPRKYSTEVQVLVTPPKQPQSQKETTYKNETNEEETFPPFSRRKYIQDEQEESPNEESSELNAIKDIDPDQLIARLPNPDNLLEILANHARCNSSRRGSRYLANPELLEEELKNSKINSIEQPYEIDKPKEAEEQFDQDTHSFPEITISFTTDSIQQQETLSHPLPPTPKAEALSDDFMQDLQEEKFFNSSVNSVSQEYTGLASDNYHKNSCSDLEAESESHRGSKTSANSHIEQETQKDPSDEESSSDEEPVPAPFKLVTGPRGTLAGLLPNSNSKSDLIDRSQEKAGLSNSERSANCAGCLVF